MQGIVDYVKPKCVKDVRRLLGMAGWYRRFIPDFATIVAPLTDLLKKSRNRFEWTADAEEAFKKIKALLTSEPILSCPDYSKPFYIQCDAFDSGIGGILVQGDGEEEKIIAYMSQKLNSAQRKYQTTERECLAVIASIEKFRPYIEGARFKVISDHASLQWLQNLKDPSGRLGRWALRLQPYDFQLVHRKGKFMVVPDALSRAVESISLKTELGCSDKWYDNLVEKIQHNPEKFAQFKFNQGVLYKYCSKNKTNVDSNPVWRIVCHKSSIKEILKKSHDDVLSAHGGYFKTVDRVKRQYYWPRMETDIRRYVQSCQICKAMKPSNMCQTAPMGEYRQAKRPWQMISLDFIGPFPRSTKGFCYMLVVVDVFSKFCQIFPLRSASSKLTVSCLENKVFLSFGVPEVLICDNGTHFTSADFAKLMNLYKVKVWYTPRYHPQANSTEAANKTIETCIRMYIKESHNQWDKHLPQICCAMNSAIHSSTKSTPYFVLFGQQMVTSGEQYLNLSENETLEEDHLKNIREIVGKNLKKSYENSKKRYDLRSRPIVYEPGDVVWKRNTVASNLSKNFSAKLGPKFIKCIVKEKVGTNSYKLEDEVGKLLGVFSTKMFKK